MDKSIAMLDGIVEKLQGETGGSGYTVNPDDAWAELRMSKWESQSTVRVNRCACDGCDYFLANFETRCPLCGFSPPLPELFTLPTPPKFDGKKASEKKQAGKAGGEGKKGQQQQKKKEKKEKKAKGGAGGQAAGGADKVILDAWKKASLVVAKIAEVKAHPEADGLYIIALDVGAGEPRSVCAGLRKYYPEAELKDRLVCAVLNLKARPLKGILSEAMILAGNSEDGSTVRLLAPSPGSKVGEVISLPDVESAPVETINAKAWKRIVENFKVAKGEAQVAGKTLASPSGPCLVPDLADGSSIH